MNARHLFAVVLAILLAPAASAQADEKPVRIGVIEGLTGFAAEDGQNVVRAVQLAAKELSSNGRSIEVTVEDDQSTPREAVTAYQRLKQKGVDALIVGPYSFTTEAVIPLAGKDGITILNTSALLESFNTTGDNGFFFNNAITIAEDVKPFRHYLENTEMKSAVVLHVPSTWGKAQQKAYDEILRTRQVAVLQTIETPAMDSNNWESLITKIAAAKPDLVVLLLNKNDINLILRKAAEQNLKAKFFGSKNTYDAWRLNPQVPAYEGVCFTYPYQQLRANEAFVKKFRAAYADEPRIFADVSFDAVSILAQAVRTARKEHRPLPEVLRSAEFKGIAGLYRYAPERSLAVSQSSEVCVSAGELLAPFPTITGP